MRNLLSLIFALVFLYLLSMDREQSSKIEQPQIIADSIKVDTISTDKIDTVLFDFVKCGKCHKNKK